MTRFSDKGLKSSSLATDGGENLLIAGSKTYYIEESVKVMGGIIARADPILTELASKVKEFEKISKLSAKEREANLIDKYGCEQYNE